MTTHTQNILLILFITGFCQSAVFRAPCKSDSKCHEIYNSHYKCYDRHCQRESLLPLNAQEILGIIFITLVSAFANAGGIGGGAILVPIFIFMFNFMTAESIPLSKATILAGAVMNIFLIYKARHPEKKHEFVIDYGLSSVMIPLLLAGTMIGVVFTKVLPPIVIITTLSLYLLKSTYSMFAK